MTANDPELERQRLRERAIWLAPLGCLLLLSAAAAVAVDAPLANAVRSGLLRGTAADLVQLAEVFSHGLGVLLVVLAAVALDERGWRVAPPLLAGAYGGGLLANGVKLLVARVRPEQFDLARPGWESFVGWAFLQETWPLDRAWQSFPSAHTATAAGLALALDRLYRRGRWFFALLVFLCAVQRLEASAHYLSDVLAGAALGCFAAALLERSRLASRWATRGVGAL